MNKETKHINRPLSDWWSHITVYITLDTLPPPPPNTVHITLDTLPPPTTPQFTSHWIHYPHPPLHSLHHTGYITPTHHPTVYITLDTLPPPTTPQFTSHGMHYPPPLPPQTRRLEQTLTGRGGCSGGVGAVLAGGAEQTLLNMGSGVGLSVGKAGPLTHLMQGHQLSAQHTQSLSKICTQICPAPRTWKTFCTIGTTSKSLALSAKHVYRLCPLSYHLAGTAASIISVVTKHIFTNKVSIMFVNVRIVLRKITHKDMCTVSECDLDQT